MIKHVGRHNNRKVAIIFREVPGEEHMALIMYPDMVPAMLHDETMKVLESNIGQAADNLGDALFRHIMPDGVNCLEAIHKSGFMKKAPANQVIVTANTNSSCRLDELNDILRQMQQGEEAVKRLADLDANAGMRKGTAESTQSSTPSVNTNTVLTDADIAKQRLEQASKMEAEAKNLIAEAKRLREEANTLAPKAKNVRKSKTSKEAVA
jgi:hypothetical protein